MTENKTKTNQKSLYFSSGCTLLDCLLGGGEGMGIPAGRVLNIVGDTSSGKTFLANEFIASAYHKYGKKFYWNYDDAEEGYTFDSSKLYGFNIRKSGELSSNTVEEFYYNIKQFAKKVPKDGLGIYVLDSLDGLSSDELLTVGKEVEKSVEGKSAKIGSYQMGAQKFLSQIFFKEIPTILMDKNILIIIISQVREKIGSVFKTYSRSGGKALDFYAHTALWLANKKMITKKRRDVGAIADAYNKKSKTPRPKRKAFFVFKFNYGLDDVETSLNFLYDSLTETGDYKKNNSMVWSGTMPTINNIRTFLKENDKIKWYKQNINTSIKLADALDNIMNNKKLGLKEKFEKKYGIARSREEMIKYIEENGLEKELKERVVEKWEQIENSILEVRKAKYT